MDVLAQPSRRSALTRLPPRRRQPPQGQARRRSRDGLRPRPGERPVAPLVLAAAGAALYLVLDPQSADLAAQLFRVELFERAGWTVFQTGWFGGHHTPAYSVLFPPLGALAGAQVAGALAAVAAVGGVALLAGRRAALWFVPGMLATLASGRLTFALGVAVGVFAVLAAARERPALAAAGGVATALASPVAALFAALCGGALAAGSGTRRGGTALAAGAGAATLALVAAFPEGGGFPFVASAFWPAFAFGLAVAALAPPGPVRVGGALYAALCLAVFLVPTPVGGNATRLGVLVALPLAAALLAPRRRAAFAVALVPLGWWVAQPAVRDVLRARDDPSTRAAFHAPLVDFVGDRPVRVAVPMTQNHGEARHVAARVALARGWERQLDRERNALFYDGRLTDGRYRRWLDDNAVAYVALPLGVPLDASGEDEARLVARRPPFLREVARLPTYRVFAVRRARPIGVRALSAEGFTAPAGTATIRVRFTPYWELAAGRGCVGPAPGGWTRVRAPGPAEVRARFAPGRVRARAPRCR